MTGGVARLALEQGAPRLLHDGMRGGGALEVKGKWGRVVVGAAAQRRAETGDG